jgi:hypothetical protein
VVSEAVTVSRVRKRSEEAGVSRTLSDSKMQVPLNVTSSPLTSVTSNHCSTPPTPPTPPTPGRTACRQDCSRFQLSHAPVAGSHVSKIRRPQSPASVAGLSQRDLDQALVLRLPDGQAVSGGPAGHRDKVVLASVDIARSGSQAPGRAVPDLPERAG